MSARLINSSVVAVGNRSVEATPALTVRCSVAPPIIGIGASAECDGQVLVTDDMLGVFERTPRFVKRYDNLAEQISNAAKTYADEVRTRTFPSADQTYRPKGS